MALPDGSWYYYRENVTGTLTLSADAQGNVRGALSFPGGPSRPLDGHAFWNDNEQKLSFMVIDQNQTAFQIHTGYLFPSNRSTPNTPAMLAGYFEALAGPFGSVVGTAERSIFGWCAMQTPLP
jgi:hypothetical protein